MSDSPVSLTPSPAGYADWPDVRFVQQLLHKLPRGHSSGEDLPMENRPGVTILMNRPARSGNA